MAYVYSIIVNDVIRYIGKGSAPYLGRAQRHISAAHMFLAIGQTEKNRARVSYFERKLAMAMADGAHIRKELIVDGLTDEQAFDREQYEIAGHSGLWNIAPGGEGKTSVQWEMERSRDPTITLRAGAALKKSWTNPEVRARRIKSLRRAWEQVDRKARGEKISKSHDNDRIRKAKADAARARINPQSYRQKVFSCLEKGLSFAEIAQQLGSKGLGAAIYQARKRGLIPPSKQRGVFDKNEWKRQRYGLKARGRVALCVSCGTQIAQQHTHHQFCSNCAKIRARERNRENARQKSKHYTRIGMEVACAQCGSLFIRSHAIQKFCKPSCSRKKYKLKIRETLRTIGVACSEKVVEDGNLRL